MSFSTSPKTALQEQGVKALKRLGQNFLKDSSVAEKMVFAANITKKDVVLEVGPGLGALTRIIATRAGKVVAIEKDRRMIEALKENLKGLNNVEVAQGDILKNFQFSIFNFQTYKVVANLPFYIASPVIRMFLEAENQPEEMVFIVQKEVSQRICARPPRMNLLAVSVQVYAEPKIVSYVLKGAFWPQPRVDGAILKLKVKSSRSKVDMKAFFRVVKAGFSHPRKQLINNLTEGLNANKGQIKTWLEKNNVSPSQRAETLSVDDWLRLASSK